MKSLPQTIKILILAECLTLSCGSENENDKSPSPKNDTGRVEKTETIEPTEASSDDKKCAEKIFRSSKGGFWEGFRTGYRASVQCHMKREDLLNRIQIVKEGK
ncbi:MAG: hypothetical protein AB7T49_05075 [Oligoflexales bacterium]